MAWNTNPCITQFCRLMMLSSPWCRTKLEHPGWLAVGAHCWQQCSRLAVGTHHWQGLSLAIVHNTCIHLASTSTVQPASWRMIPNSKYLKRKAAKASSGASAVFLNLIHLVKEPSGWFRLKRQRQEQTQNFQHFRSHKRLNIKYSLKTLPRTK